MTSIEAILKRDRCIVSVALALVIVLTWAYTLAGAGMGMNAFEMTRHSLMNMDGVMPVGEWDLAYVVLMLAMWWIMMIAMMLPSAAPTILLASALNRKSNAEKSPYGATGFFTAGYLIAWFFFSGIAVAAQWGLQETGHISSMLRSTSSNLTAGLLIIAGLWQFTPAKNACLRHCRTPVEFLTRRRRTGNDGAVIMGIEHGAYCLGCCWFLMALLFAGGVMNLYWIVGLAIYVFMEKLLPFGERIGKMTGAVLLAWGMSILVF